MEEQSSLSVYFWKAVQDAGQLETLAKIWRDLGYKEDALLDRRNMVCKHVMVLLQEMVTEEEGAKADKIITIENLLKEAGVLGRELKMIVSLQCDEELPLIEIEKKLVDQLQEFRDIKQERLHRLRTMTIEEDDLVKALGLDHYLHPSTVPSEEQLAIFKTYLANKAEEKLRLEQIFLTKRQSIMQIMDKMAIVAVNAFEKQVVSGVKAFQLSSENMAKLQELHQSMEQRLEDRKAMTQQLREKLTKLWDRLDEPAELKDNFLTGYVGYSTETVDALKLEIERCEQKKRENIKHFVQAVRAELAVLWDQCYYSEEQKLKFRHFHSDCYNEDLLELHEHEVNVVKNFFLENEKIFKLVSKRAELWQKMKELEELASYPNRLGNRGGRLLLEEKERKSIKRELPRLEKELSKLTSKYKEIKGEVFLINGENFEQFIATQWEEHEANKEKAKVARKARNDPLADTTTRSNCKSIQAGISMKRKVATPIASSNGKRGRVAPPSATQVSSTKATMVHGLRKRERDSRSKQVKRKIFNSAAGIAAAGNQPDLISTHNASTDTTYSDFQSNAHKAQHRFAESSAIGVSELPGPKTNAQFCQTLSTAECVQASGNSIQNPAQTHAVLASHSRTAVRFWK